MKVQCILANYFALRMNYFDTLVMYLFMLTLKPSRSKKIFVLEHVSIVNLDHVVMILPSEANMISVIQCSIRTWWSINIGPEWYCLGPMKKSSPLSEVRMPPSDQNHTPSCPCIAPWCEYQYWSRMTISSPQGQD